MEKKRLNNKIGPLNIDILNIIYGTLLGDGSLEKRGNSYRVCFYQEDSHESYLLFLYKLINELNYCTNITPKINTRLGKKGKIRKIIRFNTYSYSTFYSIHKDWYTNINDKNTKIIPNNLSDYLNPLALAIWIMDDGSKSGKGLKLSTNSFNRSDIDKLINILKLKYNLITSCHKTGTQDQYCIYISSKSMPLLWSIVRKFIHSSMKYKFGDYILTNNL